MSTIIQSSNKIGFVEMEQIYTLDIKDIETSKGIMKSSLCYDKENNIVKLISVVDEFQAKVVSNIDSQIFVDTLERNVTREKPVVLSETDLIRMLLSQSKKMIEKGDM